MNEKDERRQVMESDGKDKYNVDTRFTINSAGNGLRKCNILSTF